MLKILCDVCGRGNKVKAIGQFDAEEGKHIATGQEKRVLKHGLACGWHEARAHGLPVVANQS
jgi:hypothetical protein